MHRSNDVIDVIPSSKLDLSKEQTHSTKVLVLNGRGLTSMRLAMDAALYQIAKTPQEKD